MRIILKDNTDLTVSENCTATSIIAEFNSAEDIEKFRKKLTDDNLSSFKYLNDDEKVSGEYKNYKFEDVTYSEQKNMFIAIFNIKQLSDIEVRLAAVEAEQTTQNDALAEMSEVVYSE